MQGGEFLALVGLDDAGTDATPTNDRETLVRLLDSVKSTNSSGEYILHNRGAMRQWRTSAVAALAAVWSTARSQQRSEFRRRLLQLEQRLQTGKITAPADLVRRLSLFRRARTSSDRSSRRLPARSPRSPSCTTSSCRLLLLDSRTGPVPPARRPTFRGTRSPSRVGSPTSADLPLDTASRRSRTMDRRQARSGPCTGAFLLALARLSQSSLVLTLPPCRSA